VVIGTDSIKGGQAPVGWRSPVAQKRSVNSLPLSVRSLVILNGACLMRRLRKPPAEVTDLIPADFDVNPAGGMINGSEEIRALILVRHLR